VDTGRDYGTGRVGRAEKNENQDGRDLLKQTVTFVRLLSTSGRRGKRWWYGKEDIVEPSLRG
jgi:hypothetical protein